MNLKEVPGVFLSGFTAALIRNGEWIEGKSSTSPVTSIPLFNEGIISSSWFPDSSLCRSIYHPPPGRVVGASFVN